MQKRLRLGSIIITLFIISLPLAAWWQRWNIFDWSRLRNYQPSSEVIKLAQDTTMSTTGSHLFFVYHPSLEGKTEFNGHCSDSERTIVLGCYVSQEGIYIYNVSDKRLDGIHEVTSAHEMLHAAYERLDSSEKTRINKLLYSTFANVTDKRILDTVEQYRKKDPSVVANELHSILGTEVKTLPLELENYYKRYFNDRSKVVSYSEQYEQAFDARKKQVDADDVELKALKPQITSLEDSLQNQLKNLKSQKSQMDGFLSEKKYEEYNAMVPTYNANVISYNRDVAKVGRLIDQYNNLVKERNALALEENELIKAIDSRPSTVAN
jgi:hypothetical protein